MAQEKAHSLIQKAQSWEELHTGLAKVGMRYVRKGSGAVIYVGETPIKASSVDRNFAIGRLVKRLGEFEASTCTTEIAPAPEPEPVSHIAKKEWQEYQEEHRRQSAVRSQERVRRAETERLEAEKQRHEREATLARIAPYGISVLNIARHCMLVQQQGQKAERKKQQHRDSHKLPRFKHWLASKNQWLAQIWRFRNRIAPDMWVKQYNFPQRSNPGSPLYAFQAMVREKFADIHMFFFSAGCRYSPVSPL